MKEGKWHYNFHSALNQRIIDALSGGLALYLAYQLRFDWRVPPTNQYQMWLLLPAAMLGHVLVSFALGVDRIVWRYVSLTDALSIGKSYVLFSTILLATRLGLPDRLWMLRVPRSVIVIEFLLALFAALGVRVTRRIIYERSLVTKPNATEPRRVLLIGAGRAGVMVAREIASRAELKPAGFLDDDRDKRRTVIGGLKVLGPIASLPAIVKQFEVQEVIVCIPRVPRTTLQRVWALSEAASVPVKIVPALEEILQKKASIAAFRDIELADLLEREPVKLSLDDTSVVMAYGGKRILITGAGGSIGSELASQLLSLKPQQLILLDKDENGLNDACLRLGNVPDGPVIHPVVADLRFPARLKDVFLRFRPDVVFHSAAHKHVHLMEMNPCEAILNNVVGTHNLVEQALAFSASRFVLISTDKAVEPTCIMGASKRLCEMIVQARASRAQGRFCCVRFGNVIGSRGSVVPIFKRQIARGGPVTITHPDVERFLMTIPEAAGLVLQAGTLGTSGEIFVLEMGEPVRIRTLAQKLIELSGLRPGEDIAIQFSHLGQGEKMTEKLLDDHTEKLLPTRYNKVAVVKGQAFDVSAFELRLKRIEEAARGGSAEEVFRLLYELNIGFHPEAAQPALAQPTPRKASPQTLLVARKA